MILYKALKYMILDLCLDSMFKALNTNIYSYLIEKIDSKDLRVGMILRKVQIVGDEKDDSVWFNCKITDIRYEEARNFMPPYKVVTFEYSSSTAFFCMANGGKISLPIVEGIYGASKVESSFEFYL